ncbi:efflux transporter outer membrane subunit [Gluconobacter morbifer]|uniref:Uncharacterized protein n=1 Tax=Gluconobacter morbifer G707 TaxID=1088869 RepID=G6XLR4_9PROT|nr:efflux transporter outer membrane subunit [Gluconobacter morbifer]EHH67319.1 hypothetical protein GMO_23130 [Gluconobacter morbifer G707]
MRRLCLLVSTLLLTGCAVGPNYHRPHVAGPEHWGGEPATPSMTYAGAIEISWWSGFHDRELDSLIGRLGKQNLDLQEAMSRIEQARGQTHIAAAQGMPNINWQPGYTWTQQSEKGFLSLAEPKPGANLQYNYYTNILSSSWDLDLFGMIRRTVEAQRATVVQTQAARRGVALTTLSSLVTSYLQLRGTQAQIVLTERDLALARHDLSLVQDRARDGAATSLDLAQARARVATTESDLPPLQNSQAALINAIGFLLALPPRMLEKELLPIGPQPQPPAAIPVGFPSQLAERRPDLMMADARLHAATARVAAADAAFYPDITLTGNIGTQSLSASDFFMPAAKYFTLGPTLNVPIFEGGRLRGTLRLRKAQQKEAALDYRRTILNAWRDVDDAMTAYAQVQKRHDQVAEAVRQNRLALQAARQRYVAGAVTFLEVDAAEGALLSSETALAATQTQIGTALVSLYRALGGGWQFAEANESAHKGA